MHDVAQAAPTIRHPSRLSHAAWAWLLAAAGCMILLGAWAEDARLAAAGQAAAVPGAVRINVAARPAGAFGRRTNVYVLWAAGAAFLGLGVSFWVRAARVRRPEQAVRTVTRRPA